MEVKTHKVNQKFVSNSNYVFRRILNSEDCLDILKNLIEAILDIIKSIFKKDRKIPTKGRKFWNSRCKSNNSRK